MITLPGKRTRGKSSEKGPEDTSKLRRGKAVKKSIAVTLAKKVLARQKPVPEEVERLDFLARCSGTQSPQPARTEIWMIGDSILAHAGENADAKGTPNLGLARYRCGLGWPFIDACAGAAEYFTVWHAAGQMPINDCPSSWG